MNEPIVITYKAHTYTRTKYRLWVCVDSSDRWIMDGALLTALEREYSQQQRAAAKGAHTPAPHDFTPRQRISTPPRIERKPKQRETREKRGGRVE